MDLKAIAFIGFGVEITTVFLLHFIIFGSNNNTSFLLVREILLAAYPASRHIPTAFIFAILCSKMAYDGA